MYGDATACIIGVRGFEYVLTIPAGVGGCLYDNGDDIKSILFCGNCLTFVVLANLMLVLILVLLVFVVEVVAGVDGLVVLVVVFAV
jgi:hypothetical protein